MHDAGGKLGKLYDEITPELSEWIEQQKLFFVATAPLNEDGLLNCSPKGMDTFRIIGPRQVAYLDLTGSGIETIAHLRENGRIVFMFCAFEGRPLIVRLHGTGKAVAEGSSEFEELRSLFPDYAGARAIIVGDISRISDSCGYGVPTFDYNGERDTLVRWAESKGPEAVSQYQRENNIRSLDDLPGLELI